MNKFCQLLKSGKSLDDLVLEVKSVSEEIFLLEKLPLLKNYKKLFVDKIKVQEVIRSRSRSQEKESKQIEQERIHLPEEDKFLQLWY